MDASGPDQLELLFSDECWVEIEDSQFGLIYNDLNQANDRPNYLRHRAFQGVIGEGNRRRDDLQWRVHLNLSLLLAGIELQNLSYQTR